MRPNITQGKRHPTRSKKRPHSGILTLNDLDKRNWKHIQLIIQPQARYKADKESGKVKSNQKSEVFFDLEGDPHARAETV